MKSPLHPCTLVVLIAIGMLSLAACGGSSSTGSAVTPSVSTPTTATATATTLTVTTTTQPATPVATKTPVLSATPGGVSTPQNTLQTLCDEENKGDYRSQWELFTDTLRVGNWTTQDNYVNFVRTRDNTNGGVSSCQVVSASVKQTGPTTAVGETTTSFKNGLVHQESFTLLLVEGSWKIDSLSCLTDCSN